MVELEAVVDLGVWTIAVDAPEHVEVEGQELE